MTENDMIKYVENLYNDFKKNKLSGFVVIVTNEGVSTTTILPDWGILEIDHNKKTKLTGVKEDETVAEWIDKAEKTLYFLEAIEQSCQEASNAFSNAKNTLIKILMQAADECNETASKKQPTVH